MRSLTFLYYYYIDITLFRVLGSGFWLLASGFRVANQEIFSRSRTFILKAAEYFHDGKHFYLRCISTRFCVNCVPGVQHFKYFINLYFLFVPYLDLYLCILAAISCVNVGCGIRLR